MPRTATATDQEAAIAKALMAIVRAGKKVREPWDKVRKETWQYAYDSTYQFLYQDWENNNGELFFKAKIPLAAQFIEVMGPYLYQYNPTYTIEAERPLDPLSWDGKRIDVERKYLEWCVKRADQYTHCRRAIDDALCGGRGVVWTGYNPRRGCVQHVFDSSANLIDDPDARTIEERNLVIRERLKPKWELAALVPAKREEIMDLKKAGNLPSGMQSSTSGEKGTEVVRYYEAYMRIPLSNYAEGIDVTAARSFDGESMGGVEMKFVFAEDLFLSMGPWEIAWFKDDLWPCATMDLRKTPTSIYGVSPLDTSLGLIRALNWAHTLILSKLQVSTRLAFVVMNMNGQKLGVNELLKVVSGEHYDIAVLNQVGNEFPEIGKMIQQLDIKTGVDDLTKLTHMLEYQIQRSCGLYDVLFAGNTDTQLRTAEDAKLKDRNSRTRVDDLRAQVEKWTTELGTKARYAARTLEGEQDIAKLFGPDAGRAWGELASPEDVAANRQRRQQVFQSAGQQAFDATMQQGMQAASAPMPPADPTTGQPMGPMPPSPQEVQEQASKQANDAGMQAADQMAPDNLVDLETWMLDAGVSIESGSMRRRDVDQEADLYTEAANQVVPKLLQSGIPAVQAIALRITSRGFKVKGAPPELVADIEQAADLVASMPMPAPPGPSNPGTEPATPPSKAG